MKRRKRLSVERRRHQRTLPPLPRAETHCSCVPHECPSNHIRIALHPGCKEVAA